MTLSIMPTSMDADSISRLGSLFQRLDTASVKKIFLIYDSFLLGVLPREERRSQGREREEPSDKFNWKTRNLLLSLLPEMDLI